MNAPPKVGPVTAHSGGDVVHWLINDTRDERFIDNIFAELCVRLQRAGIPVKQASIHVLINHPQACCQRNRDCAQIRTSFPRRRLSTLLAHLARNSRSWTTPITDFSLSC